MSKKSSSFIFSWPMILALIFGYNFLFDDDDKDEKTISVEEKAPIISEETKQEVKKSVSEVITAAKDALNEVKASLEKEETIPDETQDKQPEEEKVVEKEENVETLKPLEEKEKPEGGEMKKL